MQLDIVSDTICPWCFIGKRRLERALAGRPDLKLDIRWRAFQLNPTMPAGGMDRATYVSTKFGGEDKAKAIYQRIAEAGSGEGIDFNFAAIKRTPNTLDSHRLIRWAGSADKQDQVVEALFRRYFLEGEDIGDHAVLTDTAREAGMDTNLVTQLLADGSDLELIRSEDETAREMGISGVPCFLIGEKYAVSGAQDASVFHQVFDMLARGDQTATAPAG